MTLRTNDIQRHAAISLKNFDRPRWECLNVGNATSTVIWPSGASNPSFFLQKVTCKRKVIGRILNTPTTKEAIHVVAANYYFKFVPQRSCRKLSKSAIVWIKYKRSTKIEDKVCFHGCPPKLLLLETTPSCADYHFGAKTYLHLENFLYLIRSGMIESVPSRRILSCS